MKKLMTRVEAFCFLIISLAFILVATIGFQWAVWTGVYPDSPFWAIVACVIAALTGIWALVEFGKLIPSLIATVFTGKEGHDSNSR